MTEQVKQSGIISDANVLIDYAKSAPNILKLINDHVQSLYVPLPVLSQIKQLSRESVEKLGIKVVEPTIAQLIEVESIRRHKGKLEGPDLICFVIARDNDWVCLTNDKPLRKFCSDNKVTCLWGIGIMLQLVMIGKLTPEKALKIAQDIASKNKHITPAIVEEFKMKLGL